MTFWLAVSVGIITAFIGVKKGFYTLWALLFNILIAIYLGILLTPSVIGWVPDLTDSGYHQAACVAGIAVIVFAVLQTISMLCVTEDFQPALPELVGRIGAPLLGFLAGYLVTCFLVFVICIMPFAKHPVAKNFLGEEKPAPTALASVEKACNFVGIISLQYQQNIVPKVAAWLIEPQESDKSFDSTPVEQ